MKACILRSRPIRRLILGFLLCLGLTVPGLRAQPKPSYGNVELLRDRWGTPHVFSDTDAGAMYGLGYATAEDRAYQMNLQLRLMQGRLAEVLGDISKRQQRSAGINSALEQDRLTRTLGYYRHAQRVAQHLEAGTTMLLQAYCEGVNDYVRAHEGKWHHLFADQGWSPEPWTPADCLVSWWHIAQFFSTDGLHDLWALHQRQNPDMRERLRQSRAVIDDDAAVVRREDVSEEWIQRTLEFMEQHGLNRGEIEAEADGPKFSHAWVIGGSKTTTGAAVLVSDPQTPVWNPSTFYEFYLSGKTFNARGIGAAGSPLILIGFSAHVAWGMTALGADQADLFLLKTDSSRPGRYELDGRWIDLDTRSEAIKVKGGQEELLDVRTTKFGPVVSAFALGRREGEEVALKRIPLAEPDRDTIPAAIAMMRARSADEFGRALAGWRFPSANCLFGDREGSIGYWTIGAIPVRAANSPGPSVAQDGSLRANDWQTIVPHDLLPHVVNPKRGYLVSANHRSIQSFYQLTLGTSTGAAGDTDRGWRIKQRIEDFLADHERFRPDDVLAIQGDTVNAVKAAVVKIGLHLRDVQKAELDQDAAKALAHLDNWYRQGAASDMSVPGTELANEMSVMFRETVVPLARTYGGGVSGLVHAMKTFLKRLQDDPQVEFASEEIDFIETVLAEAWQQCETRYGTNPSVWHAQAIQAAQRSTLGYLESLDGYPTLDARWNVKRPLLKTYDGSTILAQPGQSYTQYVPLHDADQALSILPVGPSDNPASPFRFSALGDWAAGQLRPAPLSRGAVASLAVGRQTLPLTGEAPARAERRRAPGGRQRR